MVYYHYHAFVLLYVFNFAFLLLPKIHITIFPLVTLKTKNSWFGLLIVCILRKAKSKYYFSNYACYRKCLKVLIGPAIGGESFKSTKKNICHLTGLAMESFENL